MTESTLVSAQLAYVYPRAAQLADLRGDRAFAARLRRAGARALATTRREWTGRGWYSRGYARRPRRSAPARSSASPSRGRCSPGAASPRQARTLVANVRRFLTGVGAPPSVHGPARIGSAQSPAAGDPAVTERSSPVATATGDNNAVFVGGSWYAVNGWLTWALGRQAGVVPRARELAFDELMRNTLRAHARAYPRHWGGTISVDDVCRSHQSSHPEQCGVGIADRLQRPDHAPAGLAAVGHDQAGRDRADHAGLHDPSVLPMRDFSLRLPNVGLVWGARRASGYVRAAAPRPAADGRPRAVRRRRPRRGRRPALVPSRRRGADVVFDLPTRPGRAARWSIDR